MKKLLAVTLMAVTAGATTTAPVARSEEPKGKTVPYQRYSSYFEKNNSDLTGAVSYLGFTDQKAFDKTFGKAVVMGKKRRFLPKNAFDSKLVAAVIKRGRVPWTYKVHSVRARGGKLYVNYEAMAKDTEGSARYASPLILAVDKDDYSSVVFLEDGKKVGTAAVGK